jgi:acyl dehydratase
MTMFFEDFEAGQVFETAGRTITETDLTMFSMMTGDWNPIHADAEFAKTTRFGERLVHGVYGIGLAIGMMHGLGIFEKSAVALLGITDWRVKKPIVIGNTLRLRLSIVDTEIGRSGRTGRVGRLFELLNEKGEVVQAGRSDVLVSAKQSG